MASEEDNYGAITLKGTPVADLKVNDIKRELDKRGLSKAGSKTQLVERLKAQMLLEKLQQDAALSSGDELEGKVPNMALQQEQAGQSEFVRQYLEQQQRNLERQMEAKKLFEEERKRKSADESSTDEATTPQDSTKPAVDPEVTSPKKFKDDNSNAPATIEPKMPRPARKSSRNASKGENGQEVAAATKEKSRSPSPENLRERTRSGSSSSSRSVTPETPGRKGRSARGSRGGRRGGRRGAAARKSTRKTSRSSSRSSSEEEFVPKKRSARATNSISSRSRSRSPPHPEVTATRRSSRRVSSSVVAAPSTKAAPEEDSETVNNVESPLPKPEVAEATVVVAGETSSEKVSEVRSGRRSVEVKEPVAASIETIEPSDMVEKEKDDEDNDKVGSTETQVASEKSPPQKEDTLQTPNEPEPENVIVQDAGNETKQPSSKLSRWKSSRSKSTSGPQEVNKNSTDDTSEKETKSQAHEEENECNTVSDISAENKAGKKTSETSRQEVRLDEKLQEPNPKPVTEEEESSKRTRSDSPTGSPARKKESLGSTTKETEMEVTDTMADAPKETPKSDTKVADDHTNVDCDDIPKAQSDSAPKTTKPAAEKVDDGGDTDVPNKDNTSPEITSSSTTSASEPHQKSDEKGTEINAEGVEEFKTTAEEVLVKKDKTTKKRKWGSKNSKTSAPVAKKPTNMEISSDSLKNLIGEVKLTETVFDIETEVNNTLDYDEQEEDKRDIKLNKATLQGNLEPVQNEPSGEEEDDGEDARQVEASGDVPVVLEEEIEPMEQETQDDDSQELREEQSKKVVKTDNSEKDVSKKKIKEIKKVKKKKVTAPETGETDVKDSSTGAVPKMVATTRPSKPILPAVDEPERQGREVSPARNQPDSVLRIAGLVRPFTLGQLKELLRRTGELDDEHFWINDIKSHCLAAFKTVEDAVKTRAALHGARWPQSNPKILIVDFATIEDVQHRKSGGEGPPPPLMKKKIEEKPKDEDRRESRDEGRRESKEDTRREALQRGREDRDRGKTRADNQRRGTPPREKGSRREPEQRAPQVREWDKDKMKQGSRSRSPSKDRSSPMNRPRSKDRDQRKRQDHSRDRKEEERKKDKKQKDAKADEEPPAKLLDDLFRKTKATPCIYWLPLTEEQSQQRAVQREEREKEKQKRIAAAEEREKEEAKKREAARVERQKQRERERSRERSTGRDRERGRADRGRTERADRSRQRGSRSRSRRR